MANRVGLDQGHLTTSSALRRGPIMGEPSHWYSTRGTKRLRSSVVRSSLCCPSAASAVPSQGHLTLGVSSHRELTMGAPIRQCLVWLNKDSRCLTQRCLNECKSGALDAEPSHMSKAGHWDTHPSGFDAASPGDRSVNTWLRLEQHPVRVT